MKRKVVLDTIRKRLPAGFKLPSEFDAFVRIAAGTDPAKTAWFEVAWTDPKRFDLRAEAAGELLPFLRLGDGGFVAFWTSAPRGVPIVYFDSEGTRRLVAASFNDLLARIVKRQSCVPELDDAKQALPIEKLGIAARVQPISGLQKAFVRWCKAASALQEPNESVDGERLRRKLYRVVRKMLADGKSRVYTSRDDWWDFDLRVDRAAGKLRVTYLDFGKWYPVASSYGIEPLLDGLLRLVKHTGRRSYQVSINSEGLVSVDNDRELVLEPA